MRTATEPSPSPRSRAACPGSASTSTRSVARCSTTTCGAPSSWPTTSPPAGSRSRTWWCGPRTRRTSTRSGTPTRPRRSPLRPSGGSADPGRRRARQLRPHHHQPVIVWDGSAGAGERHDKRIIQPFGEYLPYRDFFRFFSEYADKAGNFVPGDGNGVVHADGIPVGVATCYEVAFDRALTESVRDGAELIAVPTNNATFGDTEMTYQQLAMSQVRAVEHRRDVVVAATSGVSAIIGSTARCCSSRSSSFRARRPWCRSVAAHRDHARHPTRTDPRVPPEPGCARRARPGGRSGRRSRSTSGGHADPEHADPETDRTVTETARRGPGEA